MPGLAPISRRNLLRRLKQLGFDGPYSGGRHQFVVRGDVRLILPNPHRQDISISLLTRLLNQAGVTREEWESVE
jgi:predicted RNA binding protein YcfA (HicA-like mRNA interferase family)